MDEELKGCGKMWGSTRQSANTGTNAYTAARGGCDMKVNCLSQGKENNNNYSNKSLNGVVRLQFICIIMDLVLVFKGPKYRNWNLLSKTETKSFDLFYVRRVGTENSIKRKAGSWYIYIYFQRQLMWKNIRPTLFLIILLRSVKIV